MPSARKLNHLVDRSASTSTKKVTFLCGLRKRPKGKNLHDHTCTACVTVLLQDLDEQKRKHFDDMRELVNLFPEGSAFEVRDDNGEVIRWDIHLQRGTEVGHEVGNVDNKRTRELIAAPWDVIDFKDSYDGYLR